MRVLCLINLLVCESVFCLSQIVPDNYTPPAPITAPVMGGYPMEDHHQPQGQQGHDPSRTQQGHDPSRTQQFPPGAPQEPSVQVSGNLVSSPSVFLHAQFWSQNTVGFLVA